MLIKNWLQQQLILCCNVRTSKRISHIIVQLIRLDQFFFWITSIRNGVIQFQMLSATMLMTLQIRKANVLWKNWNLSQFFVMIRTIRSKRKSKESIAHSVPDVCIFLEVSVHCFLIYLEVMLHLNLETLSWDAAANGVVTQQITEFYSEKLACAESDTG